MKFALAFVSLVVSVPIWVALTMVLAQSSSNSLREIAMWVSYFTVTGWIFFLVLTGVVYVFAGWLVGVLQKKGLRG